MGKTSATEREAQKHRKETKLKPRSKPPPHGEPGGLDYIMLKTKQVKQHAKIESTLPKGYEAVTGHEGKGTRPGDTYNVDWARKSVAVPKKKKKKKKKQKTKDELYDEYSWKAPRRT